MRCVVTGATGFVGRALVTALVRDGARVAGIARGVSAGGDEEAYRVDVADLQPDHPAFAGAQVVFHLAARTHDLTESRSADYDYERTNVEGTRRVVEAARAAGVRRVVFASSVKAVDEQNVRAVDEQTAPRPLTPYGRSKLKAEELLRSAGRVGAFEVVCLRFPLVYGPAQRGNLDRMVEAIVRGRFPPPPATGNKRSMLHVDNAVQALQLAASHPDAAAGTYFVTDAASYSTRDIFDAVRKAAGRPPVEWSVPLWAFEVAGKAGDLARHLLGRRVGFDSDAVQKLLGGAEYDCSLIRRQLGYRPVADLYDSIPAMVHAVRGRT
jgi:UDP-glucose 4-epimerase